MPTGECALNSGDRVSDCDIGAVTTVLFRRQLAAAEEDSKEIEEMAGGESSEKLCQILDDGQSALQAQVAASGLVGVCDGRNPDGTCGFTRTTS